jgi:hypothetical protein
MGNKKMLLSVIALAASFLMFIGATFAWFVFKFSGDVDPITGTVVNVDASGGLEVSTDGITYDETNVVGVRNRVPGDIVYYQLVIDNTGETPLNIRVRFNGFINEPADPLKSMVNYLAGRNLLDAILISATNSVNTEVVDQVLMSDLIGPLPPGITYETANLILFDNLFIPVNGGAVITFSFTISPEVGNQYQNLNLSVDSIVIDAVQN